MTKYLFHTKPVDEVLVREPVSCVWIYWLRPTGRGQCKTPNVCQASRFARFVSLSGRPGALWSALKHPCTTSRSFRLDRPDRYLRSERYVPFSERQGRDARPSWGGLVDPFPTPLVPTRHMDPRLRTARMLAERRSACQPSYIHTRFFS